MFDAKLVTILAFALTNIFIIFVAKDKVNISLGVIICYFLTLLFVSLTISNYNNLENIAIIITLYFACFLAISTTNFFATKLILNNQKPAIFLAILGVSFLMLFASFFITNNIEKTHQIFEQKQFEQQNNMLFGNNSQALNNLEIIRQDNKFVKNAQVMTYVDEKRLVYFREKLSKNFLLQNFSILILIIAVIIIKQSISSSKIEKNDL